MNIQDLKTSLEYLFKAQHTPFIWGQAGIGKSAVVKQYAQEKGYKFFPFYLGTQSDIGDILGLASFVKDENGSEIATTFATPLWLKDTIDYCNQNPDSGAVIFLDEFNRARKDILNGMFSLALDKTFHTLKLPANCHIVAAGNPPTDEHFVTDIDDTALMARFTHIKLEPTYDEWVAYASNAGFDHTIMSFLSAQPELLEDVRKDFVLPVKVDRRSYERLNRLFKAGTPMELIEKLAVGIIGIERVVAYKLHLKQSEIPLTLEQVLSGTTLPQIIKWANPEDIKVSMLSKTCNNVFDGLKDLKFIPNQDAFAAFLEALPKDMAYPLFSKLMTSKNEAFRHLYTDPKYSPRLAVIIKEAKGIK